MAGFCSSSSLSLFEQRRSVRMLILLRHDKIWRYSDVLSSIFLISLASSVYSPGMKLDEIVLRYYDLDTPDRRDSVDF